LHDDDDDNDENNDDKVDEKDDYSDHNSSTFVFETGELKITNKLLKHDTKTRDIRKFSGTNNLLTPSGFGSQSVLNLKYVCFYHHFTRKQTDILKFNAQTFSLLMYYTHQLY
jgi:hypothetical protein